MQRNVMLVLLVSAVALAQNRPHPVRTAARLETATLHEDWSAVAKLADSDTR
jgi:hypothetical protein